jgi:DNA-binding transcriptional ArsR family regulator
MPRPRRKQLKLTDPRTIKALSHPARIAAIDELYGGRVATSTELAALTDLSASAMNYHMRALEKLGIVERDDSARDGREHPWRAAAQGLSVEGLQSRAQQAAASLLSSAVVDNLRRSVDRYAAAEATLPAEWQDHANFDSGTVYLTADETRELIDAVMAAAKPYRWRRTRRKGTQRVRLALAIVPDPD